jgi:hypothetical protein
MTRKEETVIARRDERTTKQSISVWLKQIDYFGFTTLAITIPPLASFFG